MAANGDGQDGETPPPAKISFGFSKQIKSKVIGVEKNGGGQEDDGTASVLTQGEVTHLENGLINGQEKPKKKEPVIERLGAQNDWRIDRLQKSVDDGSATEQQIALLALLKEGLKDLPQSSSSSANENGLLLKGPKIDDEPEDVDPDYDQISMSDFGAAFLRGRGWNKNEGIGRTNKRVVPLTIHAKGKTFDLGLVKKKKTNDDGEPEEEIPLGVDTAVRILYGKIEGKYGRVTSIDSASGRCEVKLAEDGTIHEVMDKVLQTIPNKEYTEKTRILNKSTLDKYKEDEDKRDTAKLSKRIKQKLSISCDEDDDEIQVISSKKSPPWPVPDLLVRVVSKKYKDGKYYKEKMLVVDAPSTDHIELRDGRGRIHTLDQSNLETVIPRGTGGHVMILRGKDKGRVGTIMDQDKDKERLKLRVLGMRDLLKVDNFDDACEYRGNVEEMDYD